MSEEREAGLKILHICPDFPNTRLYNLLISRLSEQQSSAVYASLSPREMKTDYPVYWGRDFGVLDRLLFFRKQHIIQKDIENKELCNGCSIIHAHNLFSGGYTAWNLHKKYGIPYVVAVRNTDVNVFFRYMIHLRGIGVKIMRDAAAVVFISPAYKTAVLEKYVPQKYRQLIASKSHIIPNGIDAMYLENLPSESKRLLGNQQIRLIYVGEVNTNKNVTTTLKACKILEGKGYKPKLTIVGRISEEQYEWIKNDALVEYHPQSPKEKVIEYLRENEIFVMPSLKETFGLVYVEALSQGLPIIYSKGQGVDGYFKEGYVGYHVNSNDANELAEAVEKILCDYTGLSERSIKAAKSFNWDEIANVYSKIYQKINQNKQPEIMEYQRCTRCVMDNASDTTITFDEQGHCNYCNDVLARRDSEYHPGEDGKRMLDEMMEKLKVGGGKK